MALAPVCEHAAVRSSRVGLGVGMGMGWTGRIPSVLKTTTTTTTTTTSTTSTCAAVSVYLFLVFLSSSFSVLANTVVAATIRVTRVLAGTRQVVLYFELTLRLSQLSFVLFPLLVRRERLAPRNTLRSFPL